MRLLSLSVVVALALTLGCTTEEAKLKAAPAVTPAAAALPPEHPPIALELTGRVLETLDAPGYTYLRLSTAKGEQWGAIPTAAVAVGSEVALTNPMVMKNFVSKTLNRTFPEILFATSAEPLRAAPAKTAAGVVDPELAAIDKWARQAAPAAAAAPVAKATGADAKTIAEIYAQRSALKAQPVLLRGKVVKYTSGVMGKNWLHLQDGSGTAAGKDNDITVTTLDQAAIGEVISVRGPVHLERDFGAGYVFAVMIEDAKVVR